MHLMPSQLLYTDLTSKNENIAAALRAAIKFQA
jgi:hypothetical protein